MEVVKPGQLFTEQPPHQSGLQYVNPKVRSLHLSKPKTYNF
jgi:hypothetical protein